MSDNIKVVVKVRPLISREINDKQQHQWRVENNTLHQIDHSGKDFGQVFTFDKVYSEDVQTEVVYNDIAKPIVEAAVAGFNGTIFAYGQTSSGKTYTMTGTIGSPGIIPLAVLDLFQSIKNIPNRDFVVSVSYIEIYNENVRDLLDEKKNCKVTETYENTVKVAASNRVTATPEEVLDAMKEGNRLRQTGSTKMNEGSSRSHSIFQINIESREHVEGEEQAGCVNVSQLNLVDLAGSERAGQTGTTGLQFKEGTNINKSLSSLGLVIKQLSEDNKFANYRDSRLTRILQNSLGGNAKTSIICAITPAALEETISTLQFATRAKAVKNKPEVNAVATDKTMIQKLTKELSMLQSQLESKKNLEVMLECKKNKEENLKKQIENLQRFIINGFAQRPAVEQMGGARRKLLPSRRITISTTSLLPIDEDTPNVTSRKFCTPSLKYNPALVQNTADSVIIPIQNSGMLKTLYEEPPRLITPPPGDRKDTFGDEVIEINSDDDDTASVQSCSPHHDCYGSTKTPPCILRKNARLAESNLKDLVELTEREKMYTPSVVELLEKLEMSNAKTMKLQDEIELIKTSSQEKDLEIESLKSKIRDTDLEIKSLTSATSEIEALRKNYNTKLTEWEVSYERQKNKAKLREEELLSLLEEQKIKRVEDIGKLSLKAKDREIIHFMDMSKDISLVNSDNETSNIQEDDGLTEQRSVLLNDLQTQLSAKNNNIVELHTNIEFQRAQIEGLEKSGHDLISEVNSLKEKLGQLENENAILQATVKELNTTIKIQKDNMELAQNDIKSYNSVIQELQIKLNTKDTLLNVDISDEFLENLLANEDKTIANNENLKNIVYSFKRALDNSKKEIALLKSQMSNDSEEMLVSLKEDIAKLTKKDHENIVTISTLMREKNDLAIIEQEFIQKISENELKKSEDEILLREQTSLIDNLNIIKTNLETALSDHLNEETENTNKLYECLQKHVTTLHKLFSPVSDDTPNKLDSFVLNLDSVNKVLNILETQALNSVSEKQTAIDNNIALQNDMAEMVTQHETRVSELTENVDTLNKKLEEVTKELTVIGDKYSKQKVEIESLKLEHQDRCNEINHSEKDALISLLEQDKVQLRDSIRTLNTEITDKEEVFRKLKEDYDISLLKLCQLEEESQQNVSKLIKCQDEFSDFKRTTEFYLENLTQKLKCLIEEILKKNSSFQYKLSDNIHDQILHYVEMIYRYVLDLSPVFIENEKLKSDMNIVVSNNKSLKNDLEQCSQLLLKVQNELKNKSEEIDAIENKAKEYKTLFTSYDEEMKEQATFLKVENEKLKVRIAELSIGTQPQRIEEHNSYVSSHKTALNKPAGEFKSLTETLSPPSLLTICCERISKAIDSKQIDASDTASSYFGKTETYNILISEYEDLLQKLNISQQENMGLVGYIEQLEIENKALKTEQNETQDEVRLLINETEELLKKLQSHKTILSILTATTYTENKSLQSQLKGLQHHHSRFHNVCQRDIPGFKKQLNLLLSVLRDEAFNYDINVNKTILQENNLNKNGNNNDSTFDADLLMLDTNVTITTADNTLIGYNQTCLDYTQTMFNETSALLDHNCTQQNLLSNQSENEIEILKRENGNLKKEIDNLVNKSLKVDAQCSPIKSLDLKNHLDQHSEEDKIILLTKELAAANDEKVLIEKRYNDFALEMPSKEELVKRIKTLEEELNYKQKEINIAKNNLQEQCKLLSDLRKENDILSTQLMDHISEADDLHKEVKQLKLQNTELSARCEIAHIDQQVIQRNQKPDIKHQLNNSNMSTDMDDSMNFEMAHDSMPSSPQSKKCIMPDIQEERPLDMYLVDKNECLNFYLTKTGTDTDHLPNNVAIIEVMKKLYTNLVTRHSMEVENLANKLKDYEETDALHKTQLMDLNANHLELKNELHEKEAKLYFINDILTQLRSNLLNIQKGSEISHHLGNNAQMASILKDQFFAILDNNFDLSSVDIFEKFVDHSNKIVEECITMSETLSQTKHQLTEKEKECSLLKATNDKIQEINKAVTLDIIKKQRHDKMYLENVYRKLQKLNKFGLDESSLSNEVTEEALAHYLEHLVKEYKNLKSKDVSEFNDLQLSIEDKERQLGELLGKVDVLESNNNINSKKLIQYEEIIRSHNISKQELEITLKTKVDENDRNVKDIAKLTGEIFHLKQTIIKKDEMLKSIMDEQTEASHLLSNVQCLQNENDKLKAMNEIISKETKSYGVELEKSRAIIEQKNQEFDKMTSEILVLRESVKESSTLVENMKQRVQTLTEENVEIKRELEIKSRECYRLEINIKTHEKTAEIQSRMITRLRNHKEEDKVGNELQENIKELSKKNESLQKECEELRKTIKISSEEIEHLKTAKESLEVRLAEFEESGRRSRTSLDAVAETTKRRRQSIHDSKRLFEKLEDHKNIEAVFGSRQKPDDLFMDIDDESLSGRSTPLEHGKGRDSLLSRTDHSDKEDDSRPNSASARAARRRRQSSHDLYRSVTPHTDLSQCVINELQEDKRRVRTNSDNENCQLRASLANCEKELEELKEKYKELDEECEICSQYLQERDEQCSRLRKEKTALEKEMMELKSKPRSASSSFCFNMKPNVAHVSVNTDADWTNLHSVVVDRMSYDAEVEKNKKLSKTIEELRFKKLDLKKTLDKMQKALEKNSTKDTSRELEQAKHQLKSCKEELEDFRTRYQKLDEECETCATYLKESEERCRQLRAAKASLEDRLTAAETKLKEVLEKSVIEHSKSVRKKRQTIHDMNRPETSAVDQMDASTETNSDVSRLETLSDEKSVQNVQYLKKIVERLSMQKAHLEEQLRVAYAAQTICVSTGSAIVQNQQISDVMRENQKLKKINARLVTICKKRGKSANRENEDPCEQ